MRHLAAVALLLASTAARADDIDGARPAASTPSDRGSVALGWELLMNAADSGAGLGELEGTYRVAPGSSLSLHGMFAGGTRADGGADTHGPVLHGRLGIQTDACTEGRGACLVFGFDGGYEWSRATSRDTGMTTDTSHALAGVRLGFDAGNSYLRYQMVLDVTNSGVGVQLALAHRFY